VVQDADAARHLHRAASIPPEPAAQRARIVAAIRQRAPTSQPRAPSHQRRAAGANCGGSKATPTNVEDRARRAAGAQPTRVQPRQRLRQYVALTCHSSHAFSHEQRAPRLRHYVACILLTCI